MTCHKKDSFITAETLPSQFKREDRKQRIIKIIESVRLDVQKVELD
jgi:hypothetical protein